MSIGQPIVNIGKLISMSTRDRTPLGQRLFDARTNAGLTQEQAAKGAKMSQGTLADLEKSAHATKFLVALATQYNVDPRWLASGESPRHAEPPSRASAPSPAPDQRAAAAPATTPRQPAPTPKESAAEIIEGLAQMMESLSVPTRDAIEVLLGHLAKDPSLGPRIAKMVQSLITAEAPEKPRGETGVSGERHNEEFGGLLNKDTSKKNQRKEDKQ